ncbi:unnamed protein product, partial [Prunus brigantina]
VSWTPFANRIPNWCRLLSVVGVGFLFDPGWLLFPLSHFTNLNFSTFWLEKDLREFVLLVEERSCRASKVMRHFEEYAQVRIYKVKLFDSLSQGDHAWHDVVHARSSSPVERQSDADFPLRSSVKRGVDSSPQIPLEVRLAEARKASLAVDPKVDKSSPAGDAGVSDLLKTHFLSSPSSGWRSWYFFKSFFRKTKGSNLHLLQKGVVFAAETIQNSSAVAPSSAQLSELEKKNAVLVS